MPDTGLTWAIGGGASAIWSRILRRYLVGGLRTESCHQHWLCPSGFVPTGRRRRVTWTALLLHRHMYTVISPCSTHPPS